MPTPRSRLRMRRQPVRCLKLETVQIDNPRVPIASSPRRRDRAHLRFVASQPCLVCGRRPADPHHLRFAQPRALGRKVSDEFTVPLMSFPSPSLHRSGVETRWWAAPISIRSRSHSSFGGKLGLNAIARPVGSPPMCRMIRAPTLRRNLPSEQRCLRFSSEKRPVVLASQKPRTAVPCSGAFRLSEAKMSDPPIRLRVIRGGSDRKSACKYVRRGSGKSVLFQAWSCRILYQDHRHGRAFAWCRWCAIPTNSTAN